MKVQILMAVYNGEKYLKEQLDSILEQDFAKKQENELAVLIRDDGSADGTAALLKDYSRSHPEISYYTGHNKGVIKSFFELMQKAASDADYYALSDQDDYWMPEKISCAVARLQQMEMEAQSEKKDSGMAGFPLLYCGKVQPADEKLDYLESAIRRPPYRAGFGNAVVENICTGCTAVMNPALLRYCAQVPPNFTVMHDWWLYLTASALGKVYFDETPHILYRQHGGNVVGTKTSRLEELKLRLGRFKSTRGNISRQLAEWYRICRKQGREEDLSGAHKQMIHTILKGKKMLRCRIRMVKSRDIYRQRKMDDLIFRFIFLTGSY